MQRDIRMEPAPGVGAWRGDWSISVADTTSTGDGAPCGSEARSIGAGAVGPQQARAATPWWQSSSCIRQCVVRSIDAHAEPEHATITTSMTLMTCFARALMDMTLTA